MLQRKKNVRRVKLGSVLLKAADLTQVEEKLSARAILQYHEDFALCFNDLRSASVISFELSM